MPIPIARDEIPSHGSVLSHAFAAPRGPNTRVARSEPVAGMTWIIEDWPKARPFIEENVILRKTGALPSNPGNTKLLPPTNVPWTTGMADGVFVTYVWLALVPIRTGDIDVDVAPANS